MNSTGSEGVKFFSAPFDFAASFIPKIPAWGPEPSQVGSLFHGRVDTYLCGQFPTRRFNVSRWRSTRI